MTEQNYITVTQLTNYLSKKFSSDQNLTRVFLTGEISNFRQRPSHQYFAIKDDKSVISATMWASHFQKLNFKLAEGMKVFVVGRISLYVPQGTYSINVERIIPDGIGALTVQFEQLKKSLMERGAFNPDHKLKVKNFNHKIAVITSPSGAVIRDIITTVNRRYPLSSLYLYPTKVQGKGSETEIANNIVRANQRGDFDVIIVARGGGSIEDLWCFNEEIVVKAIYQSQIPIISSVGHETDVTLADLVADVRAATPTAAAELATPFSVNDLINLTINSKNRIYNATNKALKHKQEKLLRFKNSVVFKQPDRLYDGQTQKVDILSERLKNIISKKIEREKSTLTLLESKLTPNFQNRINQEKNKTHYLSQQLKPLFEKNVTKNRNRLEQAKQSLTLLDISKIKARGFSIIKNENGKIISDAHEINTNDILSLDFYKGEKKVKVL